MVGENDDTGADAGSGATSSSPASAESPVPAERFPLERRAGGDLSSGADNRPAQIAVDQVKPMILKHCQRYRKDGRAFSVASLDILEYEHVLNEFGAAAAEQLDRLGKLVCMNSLRGSDRICAFEPGHLIILLPDTDSSAAKSVMSRITQSVASAKLNYRNKPLRASAAFSTASCSQPKSDTLSGGIVVPDAEALLEAIGYKFDELGELHNTQISSMKMFAKKKLTFSGSFTVWSDRYVNTQRYETVEQAEKLGVPPGLTFVRATAQDQWQAGRKVMMSTFELADRNSRFDLTVLAAVARRARLLQQADHPGIAKLIDFHSYEQRHLYFVENPVEGTKLEMVSGDSAFLLNLGVQLCNTLIYLHGLMPPLIPPQLEPENFLVTPEGQLVMIDYALGYVLDPLTVESQGEGLDQRQTLELHERFNMGNLISLLNWMSSRSTDSTNDLQIDKDQSAKLNTVFKVRAELKDRLDKVTLPASR